MNNDYERYDFWFRETAQVKNPKRTMKKLIESNNKFDENNQNGFKYDPNDRSEDNPNINQFFI
jgi:hypothetical protein